MTRQCFGYVSVHLCNAFKHNKTCFKNLSILSVICVLNGRLWRIPDVGEKVSLNNGQVNHLDQLVIESHFCPLSRAILCAVVP